MFNIVRQVIEIFASKPARRRNRSSRAQLELLEPRLLLSAQAVGVHSDAAKVANFAGHWAITAGSYSGTADITQTGNHTTGTITVAPLPAITIDGTVHGKNVASNFSVTDSSSGIPITYSGHLNVHLDTATRFHGTIHVTASILGQVQSFDQHFTGIKTA